MNLLLILISPSTSRLIKGDTGKTEQLSFIWIIIVDFAFLTYFELLAFL